MASCFGLFGRGPERARRQPNDRNIPASGLVPQPAIKRPRTEFSRKPNRKYVASSSQDQSGHSGSSKGNEIAEVPCLCSQPLSEFEVPGAIPDVDYTLWNVSLDEKFFKGGPSIEEWCRSCKKKMKYQC